MATSKRKWRRHGMRKRMVAAYIARCCRAGPRAWTSWIEQIEFRQWVTSYEPFLSGRDSAGAGK